jgi:uncharacterized protein DUF29
MTDKADLHRIIEELPASKLLAAEHLLTELRLEDEDRKALRVLDSLEGNPSLYDTDFDAWAQAQAAALRAKQWAILDIEHLAEEVEELRKTDRRAVRSQLRRLMSHLLKWQHQPRRRSNSWLETITDARRLLADDLEDNANVARELSTLAAWAYPRARREAAKDTGLPLATFPEACPWPLERVRDEDFLPEALEEEPGS